MASKQLKIAGATSIVATVSGSAILSYAQITVCTSIIFNTQNCRFLNRLPHHWLRHPLSIPLFLHRLRSQLCCKVVASDKPAYHPASTWLGLSCLPSESFQLPTAEIIQEILKSSRFGKIDKILYMVIEHSLSTQTLKVPQKWWFISICSWSFHLPIQKSTKWGSVADRMNTEPEEISGKLFACQCTSRYRDSNSGTFHPWVQKIPRLAQGVSSKNLQKQVLQKVFRHRHISQSFEI